MMSYDATNLFHAKSLSSYIPKRKDKAYLKTFKYVLLFKSFVYFVVWYLFRGIILYRYGTYSLMMC